MTTLILDTLPTIFSKLDLPTLCKMPWVSPLWYDHYHTIAMKKCREFFETYLDTVNVPLEKFTDLCGMQYYYIEVDGKKGEIQDDPNEPIDFDVSSDESFSSEDAHFYTKQIIKWEYPFKADFPVKMFEELVSDPELMSACFRTRRENKKTPSVFPLACFHMCWLSLEDQKNYFTTPQEWMPIYQPFMHYVTIGINVRTGEYGIYYHAEENGYNFIIPKETAHDIMKNCYTMSQIGNMLRLLGSDGIIVDWNIWQTC